MTVEERVNSPLHRINCILLAFDNEVISKSMASRLVGGKSTLNTLISKGKVRVEKRNSCQNGKWFCNAGDVVRNIPI